MLKHAHGTKIYCIALYLSLLFVNFRQYCESYNCDFLKIVVEYYWQNLKYCNFPNNKNKAIISEFTVLIFYSSTHQQYRNKLAPLQICT